MTCRDPELREAVRAIVAEVEANLGGDNGGLYGCRRRSGLEIVDESLNATCERAGTEDARPDESTDGMTIDCDRVRLGPGGFQNTYFHWYAEMRLGWWSGPGPVPLRA